MMFGGILNVALDPVLIFLFHLDVAGAAIATALSNAASVVFFVVVYLRLGERTLVSLNPKYFTFRFVRPIFSVGLASALATALGNASNMVICLLYTSSSLKLETVRQFCARFFSPVVKLVSFQR